MTRLVIALIFISMDSRGVFTSKFGNIDSNRLICTSLKNMIVSPALTGWGAEVFFKELVSEIQGKTCFAKQN